MKYRQDIDGLRAIAVLSVLFYHADLGIFSGGYVGVDVFFVISGYLITNIILDDINLGKFTIRDFYVRRIKRIFPALFVLIFSVILLCLLTLLPYDFKHFGKSVSAAVFFGSNIFFNIQSGYFTEAAETKPLLHTWSLSLEEQFYIFYPLLLVFVSKYLNKQYLKVLLLIFFMSLGYSAYSINHDPSGTFYLLMPRAWELLTGALIAHRLLTVREGLVSELLSFAGLLMVLYSAIFYTAGTAFPGLAALLPCIGTGLIIASGKNNTMVSRLLSNKVFVFFGLISYSLYLWHWPILAAFNTYKPLLIESNTSLFFAGAVMAVSSVAAGYLSYKYVETPFRKIQVTDYKKFFMKTVAVMTVLSVLGGIGYWTKGLPSRFPKRIQELDKSRNDISKTSPCKDKDLASFSMDSFRWVGAEDKEPEFLIFGDSHAGAFVSGFDAYAKQEGITGLMVAYSGLAPVLNISDGVKECSHEIPRRVVDIINGEHSIKKVILIARWRKYIDGLNVGGVAPEPIHTPDGTEIPDEARLSYFSGNLTETVKRFESGGKKVYLLAPMPEIDVNVSETVAKSEYLRDVFGYNKVRDHRLPDRKYAAQSAEVYKALNTAAEAGGAEIVHPERYVHRNGRYEIMLNDKPLYTDTNHVTKTSSVSLVYLFGSEIFGK